MLAQRHPSSDESQQGCGRYRYHLNEQQERLCRLCHRQQILDPAATSERSRTSGKGRVVAVFPFPHHPHKTHAFRIHTNIVSNETMSAFDNIPFHYMTFVLKHTCSCSRSTLKYYYKGWVLGTLISTHPFLCSVWFSLTDRLASFWKILL